MRLSNKAKLLKKDSPVVTSISTKPVIHKEVDPGVIPRKQVDPVPVDYDREIDICIESFNREGISLMDFPEATRHRAFGIEQELTRTAKENRPDEFMNYLRKWRECFH